MIETSNKYKYEKGIGNVDFASDSHKVALMEADFEFDPAAHGDWSSVSTYEIAEGNGYTAGGESLAIDTAWNQDDVANKAFLLWENVMWTADGADLPQFKAAIVYRPSDGLVIGCSTFSENILIPDTKNFQLQNLGVQSE